MGCAKETAEDALSFKKSGTFECEYVVEPLPSGQTIYGMLANPDDIQEQTLDRYLYFIARALSKFSCAHDDFASAYTNMAFSRYLDSNGLPYPDTEVEVQDLYAEPTFASYLDAELTTAGLN